MVVEGGCMMNVNGGSVEVFRDEHVMYGGSMLCFDDVMGKGKNKNGRVKEFGVQQSMRAIKKEEKVDGSSITEDGGQG